MLRTLTIDLKKDCPAYVYLKRNTTGTRALRNTALFYLRNTMTGLRKSPEERTKLETEVLHDVFTGIHMANEAKGKRYRERMLRLRASGMHGMPVYGYIMGAVRDAKPLPCPDETHWHLSYAQLDAILKFTKNPSYYSCTSQVNQQAVKKTVQAWKSWLSALSDWRGHPGKYRAKPKMPGYIRAKEATAHFTNQVAKIAVAGDGRLRLTFSTPRGWEKSTGALPGASLSPEREVCEAGSEALPWEVSSAPHLRRQNGDAGTPGPSGTDSGPGPGA